MSRDKIKNYIKSDMLDLYVNGLKDEEQFKIELEDSDDIDHKLMDIYSSIYVYMSPKKEVLQLLGNYINEDGKQSKKLIYNFKNKLYGEGKDKRTLDEKTLTEIYKKLYLFANLAEQLRLYKNLDALESEAKKLADNTSEKIDQGKILKFLAK